MSPSNHSKEGRHAAGLALALLSILAPSHGLSAQQGAAAGGLVFVDSIAVEGLVRQRPAGVLAILGLTPGTEMTFRDIQRGIKNLWSTGQYMDIVARAVGDEGMPTVLVLEVEEQDLMRRIRIEGLQHANANTVQDTTGLTPNTPYSPSRVAAAKSFIRGELAKEGIPFASIEERIEPIPGRDKEIEVILEVSEGQRITVAQVAFEGNNLFEGGDLRGALDTKQEGFWWFRPGSYDEITLEEDIDSRLPQFYGARGYLDFKVLGDTLLIDPETGKTKLVITVQEGEQYRLGDFSIDGNSRFPTAQLETYFARDEGSLLQSLGIGGGGEGQSQIFDVTVFQAATDAVQQLYRNAGYLYAQVDPTMDMVPGEDGDDPTVSVGWRIREGTPAYVNRITVNGNDFTFDRVIREQIFMLPGDVYSEERMIQSWQAISALGFFETPPDAPQINPDPETGDVDIVFNVAEKQTGSINFGTAVGGGTGLAGFLGYDQPNLFGQAKSGSVRWDFGRFSNNFTISFTDPSLRQSRVSGTISLFNSRDRFFRFSTGQRRRVGFTTRIGVPLPNSIRSRLFIGYSLSRTRFELNDRSTDASLFGRPPGTQSQLSIGVTRQTLNHPLFPTSGSRQTWSTEINGGVLGGDGRFIKHTMEGSWFVPIGQFGGGGPGGRPIRMTLGLTLKGGAIFGDADNFPFDKFWMGGVQFGQNLRGYDETTITPSGFFPRAAGGISDIDRLGDAFLSLTAEYAIRFNDNLSMSAFYDAGNVYRDPAQIDPTRMFRGAGFGLQLVTPFGPLGLDYAYGFDKVVPGWQLHFRMGPTF